MRQPISWSSEARNQLLCSCDSLPWGRLFCWALWSTWRIGCGVQLSWRGISGPSSGWLTPFSPSPDACPRSAYIPWATASFCNFLTFQLCQSWGLQHQSGLGHGPQATPLLSWASLWTTQNGSLTIRGLLAFLAFVCLLDQHLLSYKKIYFYYFKLSVWVRVCAHQCRHRRRPEA